MTNEQEVTLLSLGNGQYAMRIEDVNAIRDQEAAKRAMLVDALNFATLGSCTCMTKTNRVDAHADDCRYRILMEILSANKTEAEAFIREKQAEAKPKWQPIETAPKDGTEILVLLDFSGQEVVHIAWYRSKKEWEESGQFCGGWDSLEEWEGWWSYTENSVSQSKLEGCGFPTHWMPLPSAPELRNAKEV